VHRITRTEIGVTLALSAIIATVAVPSVNGIVANQRVRTYASALNAALTQARSESLALHGDVTLQPKAKGWSNGWQIISSDHKVLDDYTAAADVIVVGPVSLTYRASGRLSAGSITAPEFQIISASGLMMSQQCVSVDSRGMPYTRAAATC
jgi:Tfp pilus assembly protein FimT